MRIKIVIRQIYNGIDRLDRADLTCPFIEFYSFCIMKPGLPDEFDKSFGKVKRMF